MAVRTDLRDLSPAQQFAAGFGIGIGAVLIVKFGGAFIISQIVAKGPKLVIKKVVEHIIQDVAIGRAPILDMTRQVTVSMVAGTIGTVGFWLMGGLDTLLDAGRHILGEGTSPPPRSAKLGDDTPTVEDDGRTWVVTSRGGQLQYATINGARVDP